MNHHSRVSLILLMAAASLSIPSTSSSFSCQAQHSLAPLKYEVSPLIMLKGSSGTANIDPGAIFKLKCCSATCAISAPVSFPKET